MNYYLDSCIVIYIVEKIADYRETLLQLLPEDAQIFVSDLTRMECRVKPIQENNTMLLEEYDLFFNESVIVTNLTTELIDKATEIRARYSFKTPDSIHLAAAQINECNFFITNDKRLSAFKEIEITKL